MCSLSFAVCVSLLRGVFRSTPIHRTCTLRLNYCFMVSSSSQGANPLQEIFLSNVLATLEPLFNCYLECFHCFSCYIQYAIINVTMYWVWYLFATTLSICVAVECCVTSTDLINNLYWRGFMCLMNQSSHWVLFLLGLLLNVLKWTESYCVFSVRLQPRRLPVKKIRISMNHGGVGHLMKKTHSTL